ncbi:MAG: C39 family peptidase [Leptolyngbyaceae cyanobacterium bins.349]|nr:C39 family peptidase [Leptolyngbyaceae cyanobacterium bins.349]
MTNASTQDYTDLSAASPTTVGGLTYNGPREALLNSPTVLAGAYDPQRITRLTLMAEDKFSLPLTVDAIAKTWQCKLEKGFQSPGTRWLRLKGWDAVGKEISQLVIYLTVTNNPLALGKLFLRPLQTTLFKAQPIESSRLSEAQKATVKPDQSFEVVRYGYVDGHLKLELKDAIAPVGKFGYIYEDFAELKKGNQVLKFELADVPMTPLSAIALVTTPTAIKLRPIDSSRLQPNQKVDLLQGQTLRIIGYACTRGHFRLALADELPGLGKTGFVYWQHVQLKRGDDVIPYDPAALTMTAVQATIFKKRPVDSAKLSDAERYNFPKGTYYGVSSYILEAGHIKVSLTEELPGFGNTGYVFPGFVQLRRGTEVFNPFPPQVELNIPYFSQRDNPRSPQSTCNVTAIAMALFYFGVRSKSRGQLENELLQWIINRYGSDRQTDNMILSELIRAYGFPKSTFSTRRKWAEVKTELSNRRPVVLGGDFTASGHIVCLIGFTPQGYIVNDPWGNALTGYTSYDGRKLLYPYSYMDRVAGPDGSVWAHFFAK